MINTFTVLMIVFFDFRFSHGSFVLVPFTLPKRTKRYVAQVGMVLSFSMRVMSECVGGQIYFISRG
jgi:hypothetical protein